MENQRHTPGPWGIAPETNGTLFIAYSVKPWRIRQTLIRGEFTAALNPNWQADMRLMSAAPDLLERAEADVIAMRYAIDSLASGEPDRHRAARDILIREYDRTMAIIAKAGGEA